MTQTSGKTGPEVGVGGGRGAPEGVWRRGDVSFPFPGCGGPDLRKTWPASSSSSHLVIIRNGRQVGAGSASRLIWGCELGFPRHMTLFLNLALVPVDPPKS